MTRAAASPARDAGVSLPPGFEPEELLRPRTPDEVRDALLRAGRDELGVLVLGQGGGTPPLPPSRRHLALSLGACSGIQEYEAGDLTFTAAAGTSLGELASRLETEGQWLPVDPPRTGARTVGGLVAGGLTGPLQAGYGAVRDQVLGLTVITADGRTLRLGGRVMKNVAGFDMVRLWVGSRGRLGVVVSASLRVFPRPAAERILVLEGEGRTELLDAARAVATAPIVPASAVLLRRIGPGTDGLADGAFLVVRLLGSEAVLDADQVTLERTVERSFRTTVPGDGLLDSLASHGAAGPLAFRHHGLPGDLAGRWSAADDALPAATLHADVLSGTLRGSLGEGEADGASVGRIRALARARGTPVLFTAVPAGLHDAVTPWEPTGGRRRLEDGLVGSFDPERILTPARYAR